VYLPSWVHFGGSAKRLDVWRERNRVRVLEVIRDLEIELIDIQEVFASSDERDSYFLGWGKHYSAEGYSVTARAILDELQVQ
jgi:hypothetical protein